jgi:curved DNA-binding protein CbpA
MSLSVNDYIKYDLYQLFLLNKANFTLSNLRKAYQQQVLVYHPDKFSSELTDDEKKEKMDIFLLINSGYTVLSNETTRQEYNEKRDAYLSEEKGFGNLKSQFYSDRKKYTLSKEEMEAKKEEATLLFKKQMEEMNAELEKHALNNPINVNTERLTVNSETVVENSELKNMLISEKVKPSDNFNDELSNITNNRNTKIENDGTKEYNSLTNEITPKYAFIDEAFKS